MSKVWMVFPGAWVLRAKLASLGTMECQAKRAIPVSLDHLELPVPGVCLARMAFLEKKDPLVRLASKGQMVILGPRARGEEWAVWAPTVSTAFPAFLELRGRRGRTATMASTALRALAVCLATQGLQAIAETSGSTALWAWKAPLAPPGDLAQWELQVRRAYPEPRACQVPLEGLALWAMRG